MAKPINHVFNLAASLFTLIACIGGLYAAISFALAASGNSG